MLGADRLGRRGDARMIIEVETDGLDRQAD